MGDRSAAGSADAGDWIAGPRRSVDGPDIWWDNLDGQEEGANATVWDSLVASAQFYRDHVVLEEGFDQWHGKRQGGWIASRGTGAPNRTKRPVRLPRNDGISLWKLEQMDFKAVRDSRRRMAEWSSPTYVRPSIVNGNTHVNLKKRDNSISGRSDLKAIELEKTVERVIRRENEKLRGDIINAIAASTRFDPVAEAETYTEEEAA